ncbi:MAG TPA: sugar-transfer associated ATP-grasp domain-containing protein [Stellaceae bacterium]|nr:sugar-transfer associated ATP-grasp domain-containing protein [Stellaceae bacterium]
MSQSAQTIVDWARPAETSALDPLKLRAMREAGGMSYVELVADYARLAFGPGRLAFEEYVSLRLFDRARYEGADKHAFVGKHVSQKIWRSANFRIDRWGILESKIASAAILSANGLPVIPLAALFRADVGLPSPTLLRSAEELSAFLRRSDRYPLFGKPTDGIQSLGSVSLERYDGATDRLVTLDGRDVALADFVAEVTRLYPTGYLFQPRLEPHALVRQICGNRLATVRVLTILEEAGPRILRASWKLPAGRHAADNFWRSGNLLAQLDARDGRVLRVLRGTGLDLREVSQHPDSAYPFAGLAVPNWPVVLRLALEGAKVLPRLGLIGWDIAPTDAGAVIVEMNATPDFVLAQLADGRGILDAEFCSFLAERRRLGKEWLRNGSPLV